MVFGRSRDRASHDPPGGGHMGLAASIKRFSVDGLLDYFIPAEIRVSPDSHRRARMFMLSHAFGPFLGNVIPLYLYLVGVEQDYRFWVFAGSITAFWIYPFVLKWTRRYTPLAFISIQNLLFCILWACYSYGGIYSPFLPWLLVAPILAFFYLPSTGIIRDGLLVLIGLNVAVFSSLVVTGYDFPDVDLELFQLIGIISTISASTYLAMMSLYFARILKEQQKFEREVGELIATTENLQSITAAAHQASAAKSDFVASMSHELRTPLNAVIGYSQLMLDDAREEGDENIVRDLENINGAGTHLLRLVDDILDFSKIEAGKMDIHFVRENLGHRLSEMARSVAPALADRSYKFETDLEHANVTLQTDWNALIKGVRHILLGAATAPEGGLLRMTVLLTNDEVPIIMITDPNGARDGRSSEALFDIFTDDRDASPTKYGGAGIALALGQKLIGLIGGSVSAAQNARGSRTFTIIIPQCEERAKLLQAAE
jgi:signal transduction histidine kinase